MNYLAPIINLLVLIGYIFMAEEKRVFELGMPWWVWLIFVIYLCFFRFADGLQNTTRNLARILLIKMGESDEDRQRVASIQLMLTPNLVNYIAVPWIISSIASFSAILFEGGWALALVSIILPSLGFPWIIPIFYQFHMRFVHKYVRKNGAQKLFECTQLGINYAQLDEVLYQGVTERKNPQQWWANLKFKGEE